MDINDILKEWETFEVQSKSKHTRVFILPGKVTPAQRKIIIPKCKQYIEAADIIEKYALSPTDVVKIYGSTTVEIRLK